jgi:23S rRNA (adenine2503-C2)-methyltransferase
LAAELNIEPFRARQISQWVFQKQALSVDTMTNLSKQARQQLSDRVWISSFVPERIDSSRDGSKKFLFRTSDGHGIETVMIPESRHATLCLSTQIGCAMGCRFCYTGRSGLVRNLSAAEIVNQVSAVLSKEQFGEKMPNLVFMGMGEPLANYDNTLKSIRILLSTWGFNFSHRKITVSTSGLIPQINRLGQDLPVNLAISLNASNDEIRDYIMPVNKKFPIRGLLEAARRFPLPARKRITFEYVLIRDVNDAPEHARELSRLLRGIPCKINLIPFNPHPGATLCQPEERQVAEFQSILHERHFTAPIRRSKGSDICAACGQLGGVIR